MIRLIRGNLLEADTEAIVNTVNTVGVMGRGIALQFKRAFPENFKVYKKACKAGEFSVGQMLTVKTTELGNPRYIINFPTKKHWKGKSQLDYIELGLQALVEEIQRLGIKSIALPPLGCGLGGLAWHDVLQAIESALRDLDEVDVLVFEPVGKPPAKTMKTSSDRPKMTQSHATLLTLMNRYVEPLIDDEVTLLEVHKLMYFMQEIGQPLKLDFVKGKYGPYAKNLRHVLVRIEGHFIDGFSDGSEEPGKTLELRPGASDEAKQFLKQHSTMLHRFEQVERLIDGCETAYGLELLGSVHWVTKNERISAKSVDEAIRLVHAWNPRKEHFFRAEHIKFAWIRLSEQGWI